MVRRLVLGCGSVGQSIVEAIVEWEGSLLVIDPDRGRVEALRNDNIPAECGDPTAREIVSTADGPIDTIIVTGGDPATNRAAAVTARAAHPDAYLVVYTGRNVDSATRDAMAVVADRLIDHGESLATYLLSHIDGEAGDRLWRLQRLFRSTEGRLGIFMHDNPDPDAIASAIALREMAQTAGLAAEACYYGEIAHQENRAFVNLLDLDLRNLDPAADGPDAYDAIALIDHSRPGVNDQLPPDTAVDIVIDHHPPREPVEARFVDLRSDVGATSTLLTEYLRRFPADIDTRVATALLYGIRVDTRDFRREITEADFEAAAFLLPYADIDVLERVETPSISADTLDTLARAIRNRTQHESVLVSGVGALGNRDTLSQAADHLLNMEDVSAALVFGYRDGTVYASARTRGTDLDIGETMRQAFGQIGSAGGHGDMAGAQLPLGIIGEVDESSETLEAIVADVITNRFFEVIEQAHVVELVGFGENAPAGGERRAE